MNNTKMKLLVVGHSVEDHVDINGNVRVKPGGIYYSASALLNFKEPGDEIYLCSSASPGNYDLFKPVFKKLNTKYLHFIESIPSVYLKIHEKGEREECYGSLTGNLDLNLDGINLFDGIYINMITGYDLSLNQVLDLRKAFKGLIYMDVHTFSRGIEANMKRIFRIIPEFPLWAQSMDIIQVNAHELLTLSSRQSPGEIIKEILEYGSRFLIVTNGEQGSTAYFLRNSEPDSIIMPAVKVETKNKIGCGDAFGSIFFYSYLKSGSLQDSLKKANAAGACAASYEDLNDFENLKQDVIARLN